jgi:RsiW-degrading membrane proteinase PrsW (M82 family)
MFFNFFIIILISFISLLPIVFWWYIFSYIDNSQLSRKRFIVWLIGGVLSAIPILFLSKYLEEPWFRFLNIFEKITQVSWFSSSLIFMFSLLFFLFILVGTAFVGISWTQRSKSILRVYLKNIVYFSIFIWGISLFVLLFSLIWVWGGILADNSIWFWSTIFNTVKLIIFYYMLIAFIEEASKHFNFLQSSVDSIQTVEKWVLYAIFVALGFAFIENILYFYSSYLENGLNWNLAQLYFFRSVFTIMVHILCSAIVWYGFSKAFLAAKKSLFHIYSLKTFFIGLFFWVFLHLLFDVSIEFGFSFMIMVYFVGWYLYVSSIFYKE